MSKEIIYVMDTVVPGIIKIGKTGSDQFETRMRFLESNGYANITGLSRAFAIEVDEYDEKEKLFHKIFDKSKVGETELFALNIDLVKSLFSSLDGRVVYPVDKSKSTVFNEATEEMQLNSDSGFLPDGEYRIRRNVKGFGEVKGNAIVKDGIFVLLRGSVCGNTGNGYVPTIRRTAKIVNNILQEDIICNNPSSAGYVVIGRSNNGWVEWKDIYGDSINKYRSNL